MRTAAIQLQDRTGFGRWRLAATWILILAFALQSYVTQTHFHPATIQVVAHSSVHTAPPGGSEEVACPLCQAVASAGAFVATDSVATLPIGAWAAFACRAPVRTGLTLTPAGFAWRSRAPPQA